MAGVESAVQIHIDRGDNLNARDSNGQTALMLSAARNKPAICKLLLEAGADDGFLDLLGRTALAIAVGAGAQEAIAVLSPASAVVGTFDDPATGTTLRFHIAAEPSVARAAEIPARIGERSPEYGVVRLAAIVELEGSMEPEDTADFDLHRWEPEEDRPPPTTDSSVAHAASEIQIAISEHEPLDSSADWKDVNAYLPEKSLPWARTDDPESRERLRLLLLRAIREGSVPHMEVELLSVNHDRSENPETEALLNMVVNDLGAEVDERFEYASANENFEVHVNAEETPDEEEIVDDAMARFDALAARHNEPLHIYQREFQRERLLTGQEEIELGQTMESALGMAIDALAAWPRGIRLTLAAGRMVMTGHRPLNWMSLGPGGVVPDPDPALDGEGEGDAEVVDQADQDIEPDGDSPFHHGLSPSIDASDFMGALGQLSSLPVGTVQQSAGWRVVRETLSSLRLNRRFLLELADAAGDGDPDSADEYNSAIKEYRRARDRMAVANLKLAFHLAKKYRYSGEPLDDLAQEGNIGLLKAVDRFDWRLGFKFSTYATWWIRQHIGRHVADRCRTIRLPVHVHEKAQRLYRETQAFESQTGRAPELDEIAARMNVSVHKVAALQRIAPEPWPIHEVPIDDLIAVEARSDCCSPDPMDIVAGFEVRDAIDMVLATLKPKEAQIVRLRFGIGVRDSLTLEEIGQRYELTRERIRQIEAKAIRKLKNKSRMDALARAVFGGPISAKEDEDADNSNSEGSEQVKEVKPPQHPAEPTTALASARRPAPRQSPKLDRLLSHAAELGIPIEDDRNGPSGRIWVTFIDAPDYRYRRLARTLLASGFEFSPGKGYWR